jgi:hypothetical protein
VLQIGETQGSKSLRQLIPQAQLLGRERRKRLIVSIPAYNALSHSVC